MDDVQPGLDGLQLIGRIAQLVQGIPDLIGNVLDLVFQVRQPLLEAGIVIGIPGDAGQGIGRLGKQRRSAVAVVSAQQGLGCLLQALGELLGILQQLPALLQNLVLPAFQVRLFNLGDLVFQSFHAAQLFALVHGHPVDLAAQLGNGCEFLPVVGQKPSVIRKGIQKAQMVLLIKKRRGIVLPVDIDELNAQLVQDRHGHKSTVHPADVFTVQKDIPLDHGLPVIFHAVFLEPRKIRHFCEDRPDGGLAGPGPDHIPVSPLAQDGGNGVDDNGFARAGLTGEDIKALVEGNIRLLNDCDVLNVQKAQQSLHAPYFRITALISPEKAAAAWPSRMTITTVSSPARVPRTAPLRMASSAEAAALAIPGRVWITTRFSA